MRFLLELTFDLFLDKENRSKINFGWQIVTFHRSDLCCMLVILVSNIHFVKMCIV